MAKKSKILDALKGVYESRIKELQDEIKAYGNTISQTIADLEEENKRLNMVNGAGRATIGDLGTEVNHLRESLSMAEALNKDYKNTIKRLDGLVQGFERAHSFDSDTSLDEKDPDFPDFIISVSSSSQCNSMCEWTHILASALRNLLTENNFKSSMDNQVLIDTKDIVELQKVNIRIVTR